MDLMYLPETMAYQRRYDYFEEQPWVNINQTTEKQQRKEKHSQDHKSCSICKSRQKRVLSNYISKTRRDSDRDTFIEEEEEEIEDCEEAKTPTTGTTPPNPPTCVLARGRSFPTK